MKSKIKMLWVTNTLGCGGAERQIINMGYALNKLNYSIDVLYYDMKGSEFLHHFDNSELKLVYIDKSKEGKVKFIKNMVDLIKKNNYDIVHAFGGGTANIYGRLAAVLARTPVIIGAMLGKKHFKSKKTQLCNSAINIFAKYWTINNVDLKPILKKDLFFIKDEQVCLLHNGFVAKEKINYHHGEQTFYDSLKKHEYVVTAVGRLAPVKNQQLFLDSAKDIVAKNDNVEFWLIGNGELYDSFSEWVKKEDLENKIKILGFRDDVDVALSRSDIFVQTSNTEGSPNVIAEALRANKPVISTKSTCLDEFIINGVNGFVIDVGNKEQLIDCINLLLSEEKSRLDEMGVISLEMFNKNFLIDNVVKEFDNMYRALLNIEERRG